MAQIEVILCPTTVASYAQAMAAGRDVTLRALVCTDPIPFDDASAQVERARSLADQNALAAALLRLAAAHLQRGDCTAGDDCAVEAQRRFEGQGHVLGAACALYYRGLSHEHVCNVQSATSFMNEAFSLFLDVAARPCAAVVLNQIGISQVSRGEYEAGIDTLDRAIDLLLDAPVAGLLPIVRSNWISAHLGVARQAAREDDIDAAAAHAAVALAYVSDVTRESADEVELAFFALRLHTAGEACLAAGRCGEAERLAVRAKKLAERAGWPVPIAHAHDLLGEIAFFERRFASARERWERAAKAFDEQGLHDSRCGVVAKIAATAEASGDAVEALAQYRLLAQLETELNRRRAALRTQLLARELERERHALGQRRQAADAGRLATLGRAAAGINHEFKNPLAALRLAIENSIEVVELGKTDMLADDIAHIERVARRLGQLTLQFDAFSQRVPPGLERVSLRLAVEEAVAMIAHRLVQGGHEVRYEALDMAAWGHSASLVAVLVNLLGNAIDATAACADRVIGVFAEPISKTHVELVVRDRGPGFTPEVERNLFEAFVTTKPAGVGLGLGLALSRDMVAQMNGHLSARNHPSGGAELRIGLRLA